MPAGQVTSQSPAANTAVPKGSTVDVVISTGTPTPTTSPSSSPTSTGTPVAVPSVVTMPEAQAEQLLNNAGFVVSVKHGTSTLGSGYVYDQSPAAGDAGGARQHRHHLGRQVAPPAATAQGLSG